MEIKGKSLKQWYGGIMKCYGLGYGMVLGRLYGVINVVLLGSTYLLVKGFEPGFLDTLMIGGVIVLGLFISGLIFLRMGLQKAEAASLFNEQPQMKEMYDKILVMSDQIQSINEYLAQKAQEELDKK